MKMRLFIATPGMALAIVLPSIALSAPATPSVDQQSPVAAGTTSRANADCNVNCVKYSRNGDKLSVLVLDKAGKIFKARTFALPRKAKLTYREPPHSGNVTDDEFSTLSAASTYQYTSGGTMHALVVTVVRLFRHDELIHGSIYDHKISTKR